MAAADGPPAGHPLKRGLRFGALPALLAILCFSPLYQFFAVPLVLSNPLTRSDAIVVLGGGVDEYGEPTESTLERVHYGVGLYKEAFAPKLIFSTGVTDLFSEAQVMRRLALSWGVPTEDIVMEEDSRNSYENVLYTHRLLLEKGWQRPIVVSSPYHMRRVALVYEKAFPEEDPLYAPVRPSVFYQTTSPLHRFRQVLALIREYLALGWYWMRGRI
ncbi:MAG: YdcF family protein [Candidatus Omnitrophota bacterium]|nr:YdcF family protein [Candidatus Omnitrophota bacterium]